MPLYNLGSLVLNHIVFLTHLIYLNIAFSHANPSDLVPLYCALCLLARRADDIVDAAPPIWPPRAPMW